MPSETMRRCLHRAQSAKRSGRGEQTERSDAGVISGKLELTTHRAGAPIILAGPGRVRQQLVRARGCRPRIGERGAVSLKADAFVARSGLIDGHRYVEKQHR